MTGFRMLEAPAPSRLAKRIVEYEDVGPLRVFFPIFRLEWKKEIPVRFADG